MDYIAREKYIEKIYVQAAVSVMDAKTRKREFENLMLIKDNYPKYVVTLNDAIIGGDYKGILHLNLAEFLIAE